ncbi:hypothetical protein EC973_003319 [Apophysomyces ossiformis]|uniref:MATE efflux family protein n=1 Tax=Apophysomyces ossiformis TaxID=679940 RepID=A0A8H7BY84_9FUNG|nr:hypothetical protein EC973_003319 [Apophysomyces ossiformis]
MSRLTSCVGQMRLTILLVILARMDTTRILSVEHIFKTGSVRIQIDFICIGKGVLGKTSLAAQSIVLPVNTFLLMIPSALANAVIVRVGHHLGAGNAHKTRLCVFVSTLIGFILVSANAILMFVLRYPIARHFTNDAEVIDAVAELMGVASLSHFVMGTGTVLSGTLNAFGKQAIVASFNLISYYLIGLPFGLWMTSSFGWGLVGVWSGVVLAGAVKTLGELYIVVFRVDWDVECKIAAQRLQTQETECTLPN